VDGPGPPSPFFLTHLEELRRAARLGPILDVACGRGRHALAAAREGLPVVAIDRNAEFLAELRDRARAERLPILPVRADLETGHGLPLAAGSFGAVLVFRYLFRALAPALVAALRPGGLLLYETFTVHQRKLGQHPTNPDFLLRDDELPTLFGALQLIEHWQGQIGGERPTALARLAARRRRRRDGAP
jgi:SAM-dependent methyltransferase